MSFPTTLPAFFWHFIKKQPWSFAILFASTIAHTIESSVLPYALKLMVDTTVRLGSNTANAFSEFAPAAGLFLGMWGLMVFIWRVQDYVGAKAFPKLRADIRMALFDYVQGHSHAYFANNFAGTVATRIGNLPRAIYLLLEHLRWRFMAVFWVVAVAIIWLGTVSIYFSLVLAAWFSVHMLLSYGLARRIVPYSDQHMQDLSILQGHIVDVLSNFSTTQLFAQEPYEKAYIGAHQRIEQASSQRMEIEMMKVRLIIDIPLILMYGAMLWFLIAGWQAGWATSGDIVFVMFTVFNVMMITWTLGTELPQIFSEIGVCRQGLSTIKRTHDIVDAAGAKPLKVTRGEIVFDNVHFHYRPGYDLFRDKSLTISPGERVALVGLSGSGKSTFVNLILRLYDLESGEIRIDGQNIAHVTQASLRESIAMIPQDTTLFHRTLMENIRYGKTSASDFEVIEAAKRAHCHEFIMETEQGYSSLAGERGLKLSGGQRQRIAIARAFLKNAPIFILDEATSSLDSITERKIQESLKVLMENRTTIVIAHRLSTLSSMNRILVFNNGQIVEDGLHRDLILRGGHYATLWNMQAGGFLPE